MSTVLLAAGIFAAFSVALFLYISCFQVRILAAVERLLHSDHSSASHSLCQLLAFRLLDVCLLLACVPLMAVLNAVSSIVYVALQCLAL